MRQDQEQEEEEEEEDSDEETPVEDKEEQEIQSYINPDLTNEERQAEFIEMMKERFVDGLDPDFGNCS